MGKKTILWAGMALVILLNGGWSGSYEEIKASFGDIQSVSASFIQEKHMKILAKPLKSEGVFYFKSPNSLRWEYTSPVKSILQMSGNKVSRHTKKGETYIKDRTANLKGMRVVLGEIRSWLKGSFTENPNFTATLNPGKSVVLTPKEEALSRIIQRIELNLSQQPGIIESVAIYESEDSYTLLSFRDPKLNQKLSDSIFLELE